MMKLVSTKKAGSAFSVHSAGMCHRGFMTVSALFLAFPLWLSAAEANRGDVFSDAAFWFSGAYDANGDGRFDKGDLRDVRHFDDASHALNQGDMTGVGRSYITVTNMPVVHPHACLTNASEKCLNFLQPVNNSNPSSPQISPTSIHLPTLFPVRYQDSFTAVLRFRWAGPTKETGNSYLVSLGYGDSNSNGGLVFGIDNATGNLKAYIKSGGVQTYGTSESLAIHSNVWADVALVVGDGQVTVYRIMEDYNMANGQWHIYQTPLPSAAVADTTSTGTRFAIGCEGANLPTGPRGTGNTGAWNVFRGQIQQLAIWNRALSAHEVAEAFGCQADKLRFGVPDGGAGEFAGAARDGAPANPEDWRDFSSSLTSGDPSLTLRFTLGAHEAGLAQHLGVLSTPNSSAGTVALHVNGQAVEEKVVAAGVLKSFFIPKNKTVEGVNTITLTWGGSGAFVIDALSLGGSWQIGLNNSATSEFHTRNRFMKTYYAFGPQTWSRFNNGVGSDTNYEDNTAVFMLSEASAAGEHFLEIPFACGTSGTEALEVQISVNGVVKTVANVTSRHIANPDITRLRLGEGELSAGANTIEFRNLHETTQTAVVYDYVRLLARPPRGCTCLVIR